MSTTPSLASMLNRGWWLIVLRGVAAIAFGILTFVVPNLSLASLVLLFGAFSFADGILRIGCAFAGDGDGESRWILALAGLLGIAVGVITMIAPAVTAFALVIYIAAWALVTGALEIVAAIKLRRIIENEWMLALAGLASIGFGILVMARPGEGALTLLWLIGSYAIFFGVVMLAFAFKARAFVRGLHAAAHA